MTLPAWFPAAADIAIPALAALLVAAATVGAQLWIAHRQRAHQALHANAEREHQERMTLRAERREAYVRVITAHNNLGPKAATFAQVRARQAVTQAAGKPLPDAALQERKVAANEFKKAVAALYGPSLESQLLASEPVAAALADLSDLSRTVMRDATKGKKPEVEILRRKMRAAMQAMRLELGHGTIADTLPGLRDDPDPPPETAVAGPDGHSA